MQRQLLFTEEAAGQLLKLKSNPSRKGLCRQVLKTLALLGLLTLLRVLLSRLRLDQTMSLWWRAGALLALAQLLLVVVWKGALT